MADLWMDVDTALSEVPVNLMPLLDATDFKTIEADVNYNAAGLSLIWHFVTTGGAYSQTAVTPTDTGGNYDWVEQGNGLFTIEIPASGGASINNDTEGFGWFTGVATGVLPWRGPVIGFRAAAVNDALIDGGDLLDVNVTAVAGATAAAANLDRSARTIVRGTIDTGSSTTSLVTSSLDPAAAVTDQFKGRTVIFDRDTTTANLRGQATDITASTSAGVLTVSALSDAPASGDTFCIL